MRRCSHRPGDTRDRQHHRGLGEARKSPPTESLGEQAWPAWPCGLQSLGKGDLCCLKPLVCVHGELHMAKSELRALGEAEDQRKQMLLGGNCARKGLRWGTGEPEAQLLCRACRSFPAGPSHISHPTSHIPYPTSHVPHPTCHVPRLLSHIPHLTSHVCGVVAVFRGQRLGFSCCRNKVKHSRIFLLPRPHVLALCDSMHTWLLKARCHLRRTLCPGRP